MEFNIKNVCKVNNADIVVNGITVISGYNDTGKTTVLKSLYAFLKTFGNKLKNIEDERWKSVYNNILNKQLTHVDEQQYFMNVPFEILTVLCDTLKKKVKNVENLNYEVFKNIYLQCCKDYKEDKYFDTNYKKEIPINDNIIKGLYIGIDEIIKRQPKEYFNYIAKKNLTCVFGTDIGNKINSNDSFISSNQGNSIHEISFNMDFTDAVGDGMNIKNIFYIETKNILDDYRNNKLIFEKSNDINKYLVAETYMDVFETYNEIEKNKQMLNEIFMDVLHGRLQKNNNRLQYLDMNTDKVYNFNNIASGMKTLLILQRLVENGTLSDGSWLLIDEPESNLHPEWHIKMAEVLILMKKQMNINIVVSSHSAYFIRALEVKLASYNMKKYGNFYLMQQTNNIMYDAIDVTDNTEMIYKQLYRPLEEL